jgi:DNA invertase Pin-like site-specific DNA recombinase
VASDKTTRAAIYLRISLDLTGEHLAIQRQRDDCHKLAEHRGWSVVAEYIDNSVSASDARKSRPGYDALVNAYQAGAFDVLICYDLDRLTRQPRQLEDWIDAATERGLVLVTANGEADLSTDGGRMYARIKASVARAEVERKSARQRRAALQRSEIGRPPLGVRLTGYTSRGAIVEDEAQIVRRIFARFLAGESLRGIAGQLTADGVSTRHGKNWNPSSLRTILTNPRYAGRAIYQGVATGKRGAWTPLVSDEDFDIIQARLSEPRRKTADGTDRKHLGSGLYLCGVCEAPVQAFSGPRYRCKDAHVNRSQGPVDRFVLGLIRERLARPDIHQILMPRDDPGSNSALGTVARLRQRLELIEADYDSGLIDGRRFAVASEKVAAELAEAERGLRSSTRRGLSILATPDPVAVFDTESVMVRRAVVDQLCTVRLFPAPRGRKTFDPNTVQVEWKVED